jgi:sec-independent protein translocase protein TatA
MSIGIWQILIVVLLLLLLFGRGKISELMGDLAKGIRAFKTGLNDEVETPAKGDPKAIDHKDEQPVAAEKHAASPSKAE